MQIYEKLLEFLKITNIQQLIAQNKFDIVYEKLNKKLSLEYISQFTKLLYAADIDLLKYMCEIPSYFLINSDINEFTIPNSIKSIRYGAFYGCISLKKITIPDSVTNIEDGAFYGCIDLSSITIPDSVISIGDYAFSNCRSLTNITIPDSVTNIGDSAFEDCGKLKITCHSESVKNLIIKSGFDENKIKVI